MLPVSPELTQKVIENMQIKLSRLDERIQRVEREHYLLMWLLALGTAVLVAVLNHLFTRLL